MKILVTGGNGYIGTRLQNALSSLSIHEVFVVESKVDLTKSSSVLNKLVLNADVIIHLAAKSRPDSEILLRNNIPSTLNLLEAIRTHGKKEIKIVFASSFAVYKPASNSSLIKETSPTEPRNAYGLSKLLCEQLIEAYCKFYNLRSLILRISNVYGPQAKINHTSVIANYLDSIRRNKSLVINGTGKQTRDFIFVDDVVDAIVKSIHHPTDSFDIFNICSSENTSMNDIVHKLSDISKKKLGFIYKKGGVDSDNFIGDHTKASRLLNWRPTTKLDQGLELVFKA